MSFLVPAFSVLVAISLVVALMDYIKRKRVQSKSIWAIIGFTVLLGLQFL